MHLEGQIRGLLSVPLKVHSEHLVPGPVYAFSSYFLNIHINIARVPHDGKAFVCFLMTVSHASMSVMNGEADL